MGRRGRRKGMVRDQRDKSKRLKFSRNNEVRTYKKTVRESPKFEAYYKTQKIVPDNEWDDFIQACRAPLPAAFRITASKDQAQLVLNLIKEEYFTAIETLEPSSTQLLKVQNSDQSGAPTLTDSIPDAGIKQDRANGSEPSKTIATNGAEIINEEVNTEVIDLKVKDEENISAEDSKANTMDAVEEKLKPPRCLYWYPDNLAWQLEYSRVSLRHNKTLKRLHSFLVSESESGNISRQEAVSMIPPLLMDIEQHHKILDMCAAPGSKTAQIIEYLHADCPTSMPDGFVIGNDVENKRCYLMVHQVKRLQSPNFMIINHDATTLPSMSYTNKENGKVEPLLFDRILADVPCSGDGTLRKNPEVWGNWGTGHAMNLHGVQLKVLERGLELLTVGGRLVYSTCSFNPIENEAVIAHMINKCKGSIELVDCSKELPELKRVHGRSTWKVMTQKTGEWFESFDEVPENKRSLVRPSMFSPTNSEELHLNRCMRLCPHHQNTGGFFVAVITKTSQLPWLKEQVVKLEEQTKSAVNEENGSAGTDEKKIEGPPQKKKFQGFREEPVYYLGVDDPSWPSIKSFYGFNENFDHTLFMVRSQEERKRNIYISSPAMKDLCLVNQQKIKVINTGVKVLARSEHQKCACGFRLVQEGINSINEYIGYARRIDLIQKDVVEMLTMENPFFSRLSNDTQIALRDIGVGGCIFTYRHTDGTGASADFVMTGWRGVTSCRVYVPRFERHHFLRMCGIDPDKVLLDGGEWLVKGKGETLDPNKEPSASDIQAVENAESTENLTSEAESESMADNTTESKEEATQQLISGGEEGTELGVTSIQCENTVTNE